MKDEHEKIKKQSHISLFFSYCTYFYNIRLMHLLIDEITQLKINTVYKWPLPIVFFYATSLTGSMHKLAYSNTIDCRIMIQDYFKTKVLKLYTLHSCIFFQICVVQICFVLQQKEAV